MRKEERLAAAVLFAIGTWSAYEAYYPIGFGSFKSPGPGFFPFWLALVLCIISGSYFALASSSASKEIWEAKSWLRPLFAGAVMFAYSLLFEVIGFFPATVLLFFVWLRLIEKESLKKSLLVSLVGTAGSYALFVLLLDVGLPGGRLWQ